MATNNYVYEQVRGRIGNSVVITIDGDATSYRGKLLGIRPDGTDSADAGAAANVNDQVTLLVYVNRQKS
ncbi:MAG: hypothetical protein ABSD31_15505 [Candidatus Binataceae bacterium]|jgi:hypothetical protein